MRRPPRPPFPLSAPEWPGGIPRHVPKERLGGGYDTSWARREPVRTLRALFLDGLTRPLVRVVATPTVSGADRLDGLEAPIVFAANHQSHVDTPVVLSCLPERLRHRTVVGAGADYFFDRQWKAVLWAGLLGAVPIERNKVGRRSAELARQLLEDGWNLVIFPEGGRTPDGWGQPFKGGAAYLSARTGAPVVPLHLDGTRAVLARHERRIHRSPVRITFGPALRPHEGEDPRHFNARLQAAVAALADEAATDWWSARRRAAAGETPSLTGPELPAWRRAWEVSRPAAERREPTSGAGTARSRASDSARWPKGF